MLDRPRGEFSSSLWYVLEYVTQEALPVIRGQRITGVRADKGFEVYMEDHSLNLLLTFSVTLEKSPTKLLLCSSYFAWVVYLFLLLFLCLTYLQCWLFRVNTESCWVTAHCWREWSLDLSLRSHSKHKNCKFCIFFGKKCNIQGETLIMRTCLKTCFTLTFSESLWGATAWL